MVDQKLLLNILHTRFNIKNTVRNWMENYLSNRNQKIKINRFISSLINIKHGVPPTPPREKACSQKRGTVANVRSSRQGAKKLQFLSGCNF